MPRPESGVFRSLGGSACSSMKSSSAMSRAKRLEDLLTITKLVTVFDTYDTEAAGIASFSAS